MIDEEDTEVIYFKDLTKQLLDGTYVEKLCDEVSRHERIFDEFSHHVKSQFSECKRKLKDPKLQMFIPDYVRTNLECLQSERENATYLTLSKKNENNEYIANKYKTELLKISNLPTLTVKGELTQLFISKPHLIHVQYDKIDPDVSDSEIDIYLNDSEEEIEDVIPQSKVEIEINKSKLMKRRTEYTADCRSKSSETINPARHFSDYLAKTTKDNIAVRADRNVSTCRDNKMSVPFYTATSLENNASMRQVNLEGEKKYSMSIDQTESPRDDVSEIINTKVDSDGDQKKQNSFHATTMLEENASENLDIKKHTGDKSTRRLHLTKTHKEHTLGLNPVEHSRREFQVWPELNARQKQTNASYTAMGCFEILEKRSHNGIMKKTGISSGYKECHLNVQNETKDNLGQDGHVTSEVSGRKLTDINQSYSTNQTWKSVQLSFPKLVKSEYKFSEEKIFPYRELKNQVADEKDHNQILQSNKNREKEKYETLLANSKDPAPKVQVQENGTIELQTCTDVKLFQDYIIAVSGDKIIKFDKRTRNIIGKLSLQRAGRICTIRSSDCIGIIQLNQYLTIVSTNGELRIKYKIQTVKPYSDLCHLYTLSAQQRLPDPNFIFGAIYSGSPNEVGLLHSEKLHIIKPKPDPSCKRSVLIYQTNVTPVDLSKFDISGISSVSAFSWDKIVLCGVREVICLLTNDENSYQQEWRISLNKAATGVACTELFAYICVQDEEKIMLVDREGRIENENILEGVFQGRPHKMSVLDDEILVKAFDETNWKSLLCSN